MTDTGPVVQINYVRIPVCSFAHPVVGRYLLSRRTEGWQLAPVVYDESGHGRKVRDMQFFLLTCSSEELNETIARDLQ